MKNTKMLLFYLSIFLMVNSCEGQKSSKQEITTSRDIEVKKDTTNHKIMNEADSIRVQFWDNISARTYGFVYTEERGLLILDQYDPSNQLNIESKEKESQFKNYVHQFYIEKEAEIILNKRRTNFVEASDYPLITVRIFRKKDLLIEQTTQIGSEQYQINYNPEFLEFYELIKELSAKLK